MQNYAVEAERLQIYEREIFEAVGLTRADASAVAELLVHADLRNVRSHGVLRTVPYVEKIRQGGASKAASCPVIWETANTAVIDAQGGIGALTGEKAVAIARRKAAHSLIGMVVVRNSNHFGMGGHWALKLAGDDCIGFACSNTDLTMGPPGCKEPFMGNDPFAFAFSAGETYPEVCVDMATSEVAFGKCKDLEKRGQKIPHGWMLDKNGNDTTEISECFMMVPLSGHKGFGIAFVVELFAVLLSGGVLSPDINNQDLADTPELSSQCFACFNIRAFRDLKGFQDSARTYIDRLHRLPMKEGMGTAKYPGEIEYGCKLQNQKEGVVLPETLAHELIVLGRELGVDGSFLKERPTDRR